MFLLYVDESGTPSFNDSNNLYILSTVIVHEKDWNIIDKSVEQVKKQHFGITSPLEIHTREIYRRKKQFSHFTKPQAEAILGDIYSLISRSNLLLITVIIVKSKLNPQDPQHEPRLLAWKFLLERMNICVDQQCKSAGIDEYGIVIMDETQRVKDNQIRTYMKSLRQAGTGFQIINRIIEDPIFTPSDWRNLIQLSDAIAYCSNHQFRKEPFLTTQFLTIQNKFVKDKYGKIDGAGIKIYPL